MGQYPQHAFAYTGLVLARSQGRPETSFILRDRGFNMPAMPVFPVVKPLFHLATVTSHRPFAGVAFVQRDDGRSNAQFLPSQLMVVLAVVTRIAQKAVNVKMVNRLSDCIRELWRILTGTVTDHQRREQIGIGVAHQRQLGPTRTEKPFVAHAMNIMSGGMATFQAGGVDGRFALVLDQATRLGEAENGGKEGIERPFFNSRLWA